VSSALVVDGPFRFTRNPVYLGMVLFLFGVGVLLGSLTPFLVIPLFALVIDRRFVRVEEAMLTKAFGPSYSAYQSRVRRWL
jgi:protein-S-isoprenylcysteine O-methyltransferase Ste14